MQQLASNEEIVVSDLLTLAQKDLIRPVFWVNGYFFAALAVAVVAFDAAIAQAEGLEPLRWLYFDSPIRIMEDQWIGVQTVQLSSQ